MSEALAEAPVRGARTNGPGRGKAYLTAYVPRELADLIKQKAAKLGWAPSKYAAEIYQFWHDQGAPAVNDMDARALQMVAQRDHGVRRRGKKKRAPEGHLTREQVQTRLRISAPTLNRMRRRSGIPFGLKKCFRIADIESLERGTWKQDFQDRYNIKTRWETL